MLDWLFNWFAGSGTYRQLINEASADSMDKNQKGERPDLTVFIFRTGFYCLVTNEIQIRLTNGKHLKAVSVKVEWRYNRGYRWWPMVLDWLIDWLFDWLVILMMYLWLISWVMYRWCNEWVVDWFTWLLVCLFERLIDCLTDWAVELPVDWFIAWSLDHLMNKLFSIDWSIAKLMVYG